MARILDISSTLSPRLAVWPGDAPFTWQHGTPEADGPSSEAGSLCTTLHAGTHADAPSHVLQGGMAIDALELSPFLGPCEVIEVKLPPRERILPRHLEGQIRAPRVLFRTGSYPDAECFSEAFNALSPELVRHLRDQGCVLVGLDTPSVDPFDSRGLESHHALFKSGLRCLEGLDLKDVAPGLYTLVALPLRIKGGDASPLRAVLLEA